MKPDLIFWGRLLAVLTLELGLLLGALALWARWTRAPQARRLLWQAGFVATLMVVAYECVGLRGFVGQRISFESPPATHGRVATVSSRLDSEPFRDFPRSELPTPSSIAPMPSPAPYPTVIGWPGGLWLIGTALLGLRSLTLRGWLARERGRMIPGDAATGATITRLQAQLGLGRVELRVWSKLRGPVAFGTAWPTIAVPVDFAARFSLAQREAMLAHELAHLAGRDPLWLAVADLVCALVWWHPAVWWARHQLRAASEAAADEASTLVPNGVTALAESLVVFGRELATVSPALGLGVAGGGFRSELGRRVTALLDRPRTWHLPKARQRWCARLAVTSLVTAMAAWPWPGVAGPSVLSLMVHNSPASQTEINPSRDERATATPPNRQVKYHETLHNAPPRAPVISDNPPPQRVNQGARSDSTRADLSKTKPIGWVEKDSVPSVKLAAAAPKGTVQDPNTQVTHNEPGASPAAVELYTRAFRLDPIRFLATIRRTEGVTTTNTEAGVHQFFVLCGFGFPQPPTNGMPAASANALFFKDETGQLFVRAPLYVLDDIEHILDALNVGVPPDLGPTEAKVTLEVQLAEIEVGSANDLGLDWLFGRSKTDNPSPETTRLSAQGKGRVDTLRNEGEAVVLSPAQYAALRSGLLERAGVDFLTVPKVTTSAGREARVSVEEIRTVVTGVDASVAGPARATGFDAVSISPTNQSGINYRVEQIPVGPVVYITPDAVADGWHLKMVAQVKEFLGYDDPGKTNEPTVQSPGAKPLTATRPIPRLRVRQMQADAVARPGETVAVRGPMADEVKIFRSRNWLVRRSQTNVVHKRIYAFVTPVPADSNTGDGTSTAVVQPLIVTVSAADPFFRFGDREVAETDLRNALTRVSLAKPGLRLFIRTEPLSPEAKIAALVEAARHAGIPNVVLAPQSPSSP